ncbi:hypothetical protein TRAPUB_14347 [Trametes pubescens]|uniref:Uncharacterized protein n=1 Tax=Trametes pubescens TaxID=154538 RepID=A0A1M2VNL8_TRAPU|nr:hypothetical protein TRAPUB_14347 [Trametes pubescens]
MPSSPTSPSPLDASLPPTVAAASLMSGVPSQNVPTPPRAGDGVHDLEQDWDGLLALFPLVPERTRSPTAPRPRSATISAEIMLSDARRATTPLARLDDVTQGLDPNQNDGRLENSALATQTEFPSIWPALITPPRPLPPPVVQPVNVTAVLAAPQPTHATPTVAQLEDTVAAGPVVSTARKGKKRARIDSTSPSPAAPPRSRPPPPQAPTPSRRARLVPLQDRVMLAPSGWATPATSRGRLAPATTAIITEALRPLQPDTSRLTAATRAPARRPSPAPNAQAGPSSRRRVNDENAVPEQPIFEMDLDFDPRFAPRSQPPYGMPLQSLDLNRVCFPDAFMHMGPLPEDDEDAQSDDELWAQVDADERRPRGVLSVRDRPPTPHPIQALQLPTTTPARVVSHSAAALAASFTPSQPIPIPAGPAQPTGPVAGTATYLAAQNPALPTAGGNFQFTPVPPGGFPTVWLADPDGLFTGLSPARGVALRGEEACFIARIYNLTHMTQHDLRQGAALVGNIVRHVTGETNVLVVPPQADWPITPNAPASRLHPHPLSFAVLGISVESVLRMLRQSTWSTLMGTIHVSRAAIGVTRFMFVAGGFAHDHNGSILNAVFAVFSGPVVFPLITQLVQTHPDYRDILVDDAARAILASLEVRVSTLQNGNISAAIFCDPPTLTPSRWVEWRATVAAVPFLHPLNSTGIARRSIPCAGCHGEDHPTHLCPFQDVPGWNAPPPGTDWAQPGFGPGHGAPPPPPPPPPPAGGRAAIRGRSNSSRRGAHPPAFNGHYRDYKGGGDGRGSGSGMGRGNGGTGSGGGAAGSMAF